MAGKKPQTEPLTPVCALNVFGKQIESLIRSNDYYRDHNDLFPDPIYLAYIFIQRYLDDEAINTLNASHYGKKAEDIESSRLDPPHEFNTHDFKLQTFNKAVVTSSGDMVITESRITELLGDLVKERKDDFESLTLIKKQIKELADNGLQDDPKDEVWELTEEGKDSTTDVIVRATQAVDFLCDHFKKRYWQTKAEHPLRIEHFIIDCLKTIIDKSAFSIGLLKGAFGDDGLEKYIKQRNEKEKKIKPIPLSNLEDLTIIIDYIGVEEPMLTLKTPTDRSDSSPARKVLGKQQFEILEKCYINRNPSNKSETIKSSFFPISEDYLKANPTFRTTFDNMNHNLRKWIDWKGTSKTFKVFSFRKHHFHCKVKIMISRRSAEQRFRANSDSYSPPKNL